MGTRTLAVLITIGFSMIGVLGDYFLKLASARDQPLRGGGIERALRAQGSIESGIGQGIGGRAAGGVGHSRRRY